MEQECDVRGLIRNRTTEPELESTEQIEFWKKLGKNHKNVNYRNTILMNIAVACVFGALA